MKIEAEDVRKSLRLWRVRTHLRDEYRLARSGNAAIRLVWHAYRKIGCAPKYLAGWSVEACAWADAAKEVR